MAPARAFFPTSFAFLVSDRDREDPELAFEAPRPEPARERVEALFRPALLDVLPERDRVVLDEPRLDEPERLDPELPFELLERDLVDPPELERLRRVPPELERLRLDEAVPPERFRARDEPELEPLLELELLRPELDERAAMTTSCLCSVPDTPSTRPIETGAPAPPRFSRRRSRAAAPAISARSSLKSQPNRRRTFSFRRGSTMS